MTAPRRFIVITKFVKAHVIGGLEKRIYRDIVQAVIDSNSFLFVPQRLSWEEWDQLLRR